MKRCLAALLTVLISFPAVRCRADDTILANGRILASDGKTPLDGAKIAIYDDKAKVVAHGSTDSNGHYSIAVPRGTLHLDPRRGGAGLGGILGGVTKLVSVAATVAPYMGAAGVGAQVVTGVASRVTNTVAGGGGLPNPSANGYDPSGNPHMTKKQAEQMKRQMQMVKRIMPRGVNTQLVDNMLDAYAEDAEPEANSPGALVMRITRAGSAEVGGIGQVYWLQTDASPESGKKQSSVWIDPVWLSKEDEKEPSRIVRGYFKLDQAQADPAIVEIGQSVILSVKLPMPDEPKVDVVVIARNSKTGEIFELEPKGEGVFKSEIAVDKRFAKNDQTISILAYAREAGATGRSKKAEDAIAGAGMWKTFEYNPRIVASRNRLDVKLTVTEPNKGR